MPEIAGQDPSRAKRGEGGYSLLRASCIAQVFLGLGFAVSLVGFQVVFPRRGEWLIVPPPMVPKIVGPIADQEVSDRPLGFRRPRLDFSRASWEPMGAGSVGGAGASRR